MISKTELDDILAKMRIGIFDSNPNRDARDELKLIYNYCDVYVIKSQFYIDSDCAKKWYELKQKIIKLLYSEDCYAPNPDALEKFMKNEVKKILIDVSFLEGQCNDNT